MKTANDLWGELGELPAEEHIHVLTKLFTAYESRRQRDADDPCALEFFRNLGNAIEQTTGCNLNRR